MAAGDPVVDSPPNTLFSGDGFTRKVAAMAIGNILEWYDFACFGALADVIGENFFPGENKPAQLLEALGVFGAAFLMRPIGGILIGYIGDRVGRKRALEISIALMLFPSFFMGCLPTYGAVGITATALLLILRLIQGLAVGGELVSAYVFTVESANPQHVNFWGAQVLSAANMGTLLGLVVVGVLRAVVTHDELVSGAWRYPFLFGILFGVSGIFLRRGLEDTKAFETQSSTKAESSLLSELFRDYWKEMLLMAGILSMWPVAFYTNFIFMEIFTADLLKDEDLGASNHPDYNIQHSGIINACMMVMMTLLFVPFGHMADKYGNFFGMRLGAAYLGVVAVPCYALLGLRTTFTTIVAQMILTIGVAWFGASYPAYLVSIFPPHLRTSGVGIAYNLSQAIFGSVSALTSTALFYSGSAIYPSFWVTSVAILSSCLMMIGSRVLKPFSFDDQLVSGKGSSSDGSIKNPL